MSSIPAVGLTKALMVVTISLHPGAAHHGAAHSASRYTVRPGDTLSAIAAREYGRAADWPAVWWANRHRVPNPSLITAGQRLRLPASPRVPAAARKAALAAIGSGPAAAAPVSGPAGAPPAGAPPAGAPAATAGVRAAAAAPGGVNWQAIAACESGGNWGADTGNGFYGGLQFTQSTWQAYGGGQYASSASQASEAQQIAVAQKVLAGQGIGAWPVCGANG